MSTPINPWPRDEDSPGRPDPMINSQADPPDTNAATPAAEPVAPRHPEYGGRDPGPVWADTVPEGHHDWREPAADGNAAHKVVWPNNSDSPRDIDPADIGGHEPSTQAPIRPPVVEQPVMDQHILNHAAEQPGPMVIVPDRDTVVARERDRFGGMKIGSAFFGWLTATGLAVLLLAILTAAGVAFGVTDTAAVDNAVQQVQQGTGTAKTVGLVGGIVLLLILFLAYYCGGYVAARMARFNGIRQGFAVWLWAIFTTALAAAAAAIAGAKYNILAGLNLPRIPVKEGTVTTAGLIAIGAAVLAALLGALLGGAMGTRYHRKVDAVGFATR